MEHDSNDVDPDKLEILNKIFLDAAKDPEFRSRLFDDPKSALSAYDIPEDLKDMLVRIIQENYSM
jgi:hypothetical protein